ncbi:hypothetical protein QTP88_020167 [Uroleucon formosanum]
MRTRKALIAAHSRFGVGVHPPYIVEQRLKRVDQSIPRHGFCVSRVRSNRLGENQSFGKFLKRAAPSLNNPGALFGNHSTAAGRRYRAEDLTRVTPKFTYISNIHTPAKDIRLANITCEYRNYRNFGTLSAVRLSGV